MAAPQSSEICLSKNYVLQGKGLGCAHFDSLVNLFAVMRCFRSLVTHSPLLLSADEASWPPLLDTVDPHQQFTCDSLVYFAY